MFPYGVNDSTGFDRGANAPDPASLARANNLAYDQITGELDQMAEEVEQFEQDRANAAARYSGVFGRARFAKDISSNRYEDNARIRSAVRGRATQDATNATNAALGAIGSDSRASAVDVYRDLGMGSRDNFDDFID